MASGDAEISLDKLEKRRGDFTLVGDNGVPFTVRWLFSQSKPTRTSHGITGWAEFIEGPTWQRVHVCFNNPCSARWDPGKYGDMPMPHHGRLLDTASSAVAGPQPSIIEASTATADVGDSAAVAAAPAMALKDNAEAAVAAHTPAEPAPKKAKKEDAGGVEASATRHGQSGSGQAGSQSHDAGGVVAGAQSLEAGGVEAGATRQQATAAPADDDESYDWRVITLQLLSLMMDRIDEPAPKAKAKAQAKAAPSDDEADDEAGDAEPAPRDGVGTHGDGVDDDDDSDDSAYRGTGADDVFEGRLIWPQSQ